MIDITPGPIAVQLGPLPVYWYGIGYALGLLATGWVVFREAARRGLRTDLIPNGMIVIVVAALIGGRLYHVIDQWHLYSDDLFKIVLPPYTGLGVYGGIIAGVAVGALYARFKRQDFWTWADVVAPALLVMQAIARWGNFFNQELYGPPTDLPWGIAIQCQHRIEAYACPAGTDPLATLGQHFQPLFLYESVSGAVGAIVLLWAARRFAARLRPGDILLFFFVWYGATRFVLEPLRADNWLFFGVPVASIISGMAVLGALLVLAYRHRSRPPGPQDEALGPGSGAPEPERESAEGAVAVRPGDSA